jgi:phosphorylcholine metabolism protein LicD
LLQSDFNGKILARPEALKNKKEGFTNMTRSLNFTITVPTNIQFPPAVQNSIADPFVNRSSNITSSFYDKVNHFLSDPNDAPEYGYQDNAVTGIGFWMMAGARFSISIYTCGAATSSLFDQVTLKAAAFAVALLTFPLTATGALLKAVGSQFPHRVENLTTDNIHKTPAHKVDQVYELLRIVDTLLRENHIDYSMDGGTLLGAVRHKGMIPWDDDGDIIIMDRDKARFLALKDRLQEKGILVADTGLEALKLTFDADTLKTRFGILEKEAANLDIFFMEENPDGMVRPKSNYYKHLFPKEYFPREELQNLQDYPFGPPSKRLFLKGPADPIRYLKTFYGSECFEFALQTHSHIQCGPFSLPLLNFSRTRYKIANPTFAEGNFWKNT